MDGFERKVETLLGAVADVVGDTDTHSSYADKVKVIRELDGQRSNPTLDEFLSWFEPSDNGGTADPVPSLPAA